MPLKFKQNKISCERLVLAETDDGQIGRSRRLWLLVAGELLALGFAALLACFAPTGMEIWLYVAAVAYLAGLLVAGAGHSTVKMLLFVLPVAAAVVLGSTAGLLHFANQLLTVYNARFTAFLPLLAAPACTALQALLFELALLAALLWLVYASLRSKKMWQVSLLCLCGFAAIGLGGLNVPPLLCGALVLGWVLCWVQKVTGGVGNAQKLVVFLLPLLALLGAAMLLVVSENGASDSDVDRVQNQIERSIEKLRYGADTLPQGDLTLANTMGSGKDGALQLTFAETPQELYLKGFVGGDFSGMGWTSPAEAIYHGEDEGIIRWLGQNGLTVPFQYSTYYTYTGSGANAPQDTLEIANAGACRKYLYLPYQTLAVQGGGWKLQNDTVLRAGGLFGAQSYKVTTAGTANFRTSIVQEDVDTALAGATQYSQAEQVYRVFAYQNYLNVPESDRAVIEEKLFAGQDWSRAGLSAITTQIRVMLQSYAGYSAAPTAYDGAESFVPWLLSGGKTGNSAYYATLSVLAYRCAGIPARYAEGYYLSEGAVQRMHNADSHTAELRQSAAHAWAEIYQDGVGWIPVETTPGFYSAEYSLAQVLGQPESAVNIADGEDDDLLQGDTADTLQQQQRPEQTPEEQQVVRRYILGSILLVLILLCLGYFLLEAQALLRQALRRKKIQSAPPARALRLIFSDVFRVLRARGTPADETCPYTAVPLIEGSLEGLEAGEYIHLIQILEKTVFGQMEPDPGDLTTAQRFLTRLTQAACRQCTGRRHWVMKYGYAYCD